MDSHLNPIRILVIVLTILTPCQSGAKYSSIHELFEEKLGSATYNPEIRPVLDHHTITDVHFYFGLNSIVEIDDVGQTLTANGYFAFNWMDEMIKWDFGNYSELHYLQPQPKQIWRPRMMVTNSMEGRDPFQDNVEPTIASFTGIISWSPGFQVPTSCLLDMDKYPFDTQRCFIELCPLNHYSDSIRLINTTDTALLHFYVPNKSWRLISTHVNVFNVKIADKLYLSCGRINFVLKRRPAYFLINIILPVVLMSFLNIFVFAIPVDSGEKIGYGITVLLALAVFLSMISSMMPQASDSIPAVTIYLFSLFSGSVFSVIVAIGIVALHYKDEKEEKHLKAKADFQRVMGKYTTAQQVIQSLNGRLPYHDGPPTAPSREGSHADNVHKINRYRAVSKNIDTVSLIVFMFLWTIATAWYFIYVHT